MKEAAVPAAEQEQLLSAPPNNTRSGFLPSLPPGSPNPPCRSPFPRQVWDERLARAAEAWAARCVWEHGPPQLMKYVGQNLSIHSGR